MNYAGHGKLCTGVATVTNNTYDLRATLNGMERHYRFDSDVLTKCLTRQTPFRINALFMAAYNEILEPNTCLKD